MKFGQFKLISFFTKFLVGKTCFRGRLLVPVRDAEPDVGGGLALGTESDEGGLEKIVSWGQNVPPISNIRANFCVLSIKQNFLIPFWAKKYLRQNLEKYEVKFLKFLGTKLSLGQGLVKKWGQRSLGGTGKDFAAWEPPPVPPTRALARIHHARHFDG